MAHAALAIEDGAGGRAADDERDDAGGQGTDAEFRIQIDDSRRLNSITRDQVSWMEATSPTEVTATPSDDTVVDWTAYETA